MRIVDRLRMYSLTSLALSHAALVALLPAEYWAFIPVSLVVNALLALATAPPFAQRLFLNPLRQIDTYVDSIKLGRFDVDLPVWQGPSENPDECEFNRLRRSLTWMGRQIRLRETRIREQCEHALQLQQELRELATRDPLTRIHNRQYFQDAMLEAITGIRTDGLRFTLAIVDVDFFKKINDTYGHLAGDEVLTTLAETLRATVRECDVVARIGGEEFGLILKGLDPAHAEVLLRRVHNRIRNTPLHLKDGRALAVTVSIGYVSVGPSGELSQEDVIRQADEALYRVKNNGRNALAAWDACSSSCPD